MHDQRRDHSWWKCTYYTVHIYWLYETRTFLTVHIVTGSLTRCIFSNLTHLLLENLWLKRCTMFLLWHWEGIITGAEMSMINLSRLDFLYGVSKICGWVNGLDFGLFLITGSRLSLLYLSLVVELGGDPFYDHLMDILLIMYVKCRKIDRGNSRNSGHQVQTYKMLEGASASAYVLHPFHTLIPRFQNRKVGGLEIGGSEGRSELFSE